jgi:hypothetical protein
MSSTLSTPGRAQIKERTFRTDIYSTWRAFENAHYFVEPYISPFYSPCLSANCIPGTGSFQPIGLWYTLPPSLIILIFPLGFRFTCYYYRKAYYRSFWQSPPACAVAEPKTKYTGETRAPLIGQNVHRWFFYAGLVLNTILTYDAVIAFRNSQGQWGHMQVGTLVLLINAALLWLYSLSCHTCRHTIGGRLKHFSKHPVRYKMWTLVSRLNHFHPNFAWFSLLFVAFADFYVRSVSTGLITDFKFF